MRYSPARRWVRAALVAGVVVTLLLVAVVGAAIQRGSTSTPLEPDTPTALDAPQSAPASGVVALTGAGELVPLAPSSDPVAFARTVAEAVFAWDTTVAASLAAYKGRLLVVADPTGEESPGLVVDLAAYLPDAAVWEHLRQYETRQWLTVTDAYIPPAWTQAITTDPDLVAPGTFAVTVTGVRHRAGTWDGEPVTSQDDVAFTVFVVCSPTYPTCHLLRLTQLDKPLR
ncbi:MAG: hypothetical protein ACTMIR_05615 [Cellulomonadaceae bacterium]